MRLRHVVCLVGLFLISACGKWEAKTQTATPDGKAVAKVEVMFRGASGSNRTKVSIENALSGKLIAPGEIVSADGGIVDLTRLSWKNSDELLVILCEASAYQVRSRLLRDPVTRADGSENAISIKVENWRYSEQRKLCEPD